ncbi:DUF4192 domain-containing protein [Actinoplanes philippinensis]|uniref:DUF4192 domain-containing protein n=1 Tax=Actinoplanes philippinensis TaxID=35752 RepID=UPI00340DC1F8
MLESAPSVVRGPAELLAAIPYVVGYHPDQCVVVVFITADGRLKCGLAVGRQAPVSFIVDKSIAGAAAADAAMAFVIGYGPQSDRDRLTDIADSLHAAVPVQTCLLVHEGRYYCLNHGCPCTPEQGAELDPGSSVIAAEMTLRGRVALPSRHDLEDLVAADAEAQTLTAAAIGGLPHPMPDPVDVVHSSMAIAEAGNRLTDEQVAHLTVALHGADGRTAAWLATTDQQWQHDLWRDLIRRVPDEYLVTPANLLAWASWRRGESALAWTALVKAATAAPDNTLSRLIATLLTTPIDPQKLPWPLPEGFNPDHLLG